MKIVHSRKVVRRKSLGARMTKLLADIKAHKQVRAVATLKKAQAARLVERQQLSACSWGWVLTPKGFSELRDELAGVTEVNLYVTTVYSE